MTQPQLGQRIADAVISEFDKLGQGPGKPITRTNGVEEWTVLAGIVAIKEDDITVVCLATGVKSMPDEVRKYSAGSIVHDMHAEILCLRLFNKCLMDEIGNEKERFLLELVRDSGVDMRCEYSTCEKSTSEEEPVAIKAVAPTPNGHENMPNQNPQIHGQFRLNSSIKLALYISEPPCGDASMSHIAGTQEVWNDSAMPEEPLAKKQKINRGRANFGNLGVVRTKPGRPDSKITYSKSCSDKLCLKQYTGILNCITSLLVDPIYLDYLVLSHENYHEKDFERCFRTRMTEPPIKSLKSLIFTQDNYKHGKLPHRSPSPLSLVHCAITHTSEVLNNGVKNGAFLKKKPPKPHGMSGLCRRKLWNQARDNIPQVSSYNQLKAANTQRQTLKEHIRTLMGTWPESQIDDFSI